MEWNPEYSVHITSIDEQHKHLFQIFQQLEEIQEAGFDLSKVLEILQELTHFATEHFETEERLMRESSYPNYLTHANVHLEFKEKILQFCQGVIEENSPEILDEMNRFLATWLEEHLLSMDRAYMSHLKAYGIS